MLRAFGTARLGNNMELRYLPDGTPVGSVSLAFRTSIKDKATGEYKTQWVTASLFGKRAETLAPMLTKGSLHAFHLSDIVLDEYTKDGQTRTTMKARIDDVELCSKQEGAQLGAGRDTPAASRPAPAKIGFDAFDDESIPF